MWRKFIKQFDVLFGKIRDFKFLLCKQPCRRSEAVSFLFAPYKLLKRLHPLFGSFCEVSIDTVSYYFPIESAILGYCRYSDAEVNDHFVSEPSFIKIIIIKRHQADIQLCQFRHKSIVVPRNILHSHICKGDGVASYIMENGIRMPSAYCVKD